jgi:chlorophyll/bacteriochlorophyll a synthase
MSNEPTPVESSKGSATRQALGMKGAAAGGSIWAIRRQLMKPITWIPLIWGVVCGAASSGHYTWSLENVLKAALCMLMSGPFLTGYTQTVNEYYDREIDAVNEPYRPIPSGAISLPQVITQMWFLLIGGIAISFILDKWAGHEFPMLTCLALGGSFVAYIYSAPPLKLKQNGWLGNYALGASYIFYSLAGLGIAVVNDFKSVEGDARFGMKSIPVMFGIDKAAWVCVLMIDIFQAGIGVYLITIHQNLYAAIVLLLVVPQITFQDMYFLRNPLENDVKYQASAQPFLVLGMLVAGLALGHAG